MGLASNNNKYIQSLIATGSDAMQNLYILDFSSNNIQGEDVSLMFRVRCSGFTPPNPSMGEHTVSYLTVSTDLPSSSFSFDKTLNFSFRLDSNYNLYTYLLKELNKNLNGGKNFASNLAPSDDLTITARVFDTSLGSDMDKEENYRPFAQYKYCYVTKVTPPSYSNNGSSSPLNVSATIKFLDYEDIHSLNE